MKIQICCRTHYDQDAPEEGESAEPSNSDGAAAAALASKRRRSSGGTVENYRDEALLNVEPSWASVVVGSAAAHAGPAGPLPSALTARDAIDDLPIDVKPTPGARHVPFIAVSLRMLSNGNSFHWQWAET